MGHAVKTINEHTETHYLIWADVLAHTVKTIRLMNVLRPTTLFGPTPWRTQ